MNLASVIERSRKEREDWRYTDLEKLLARKSETSVKVSDAPALLPSIVEDTTQRHQIVFVNGVWSEKLSHLGQLPKGVIERGDGHDYRLTLEGETCLITAPIELVFLTRQENEPAETATRLQIKIGRSSRLTLIEHHLPTPGSDGVKLVETDIQLGAQAKLSHTKITHGESLTAHLAFTCVRAEEGAYYRNFTLIKGRRLARNEIEVTLAGKLAQADLNGAMLLGGQDHADTLTRIIHDAPHGTSRQLYKSIVTDKAHGVFQGRIKVAKDAQKTDGRQLSRSLLLSDQAEMDAKPELEIHADDVACSHGCTVGELDADALFYLRARGLDVQEARALLLRAFIDEAINDMHKAEGRELVRAEAGRWLDDRA